MVDRDGGGRLEVAVAADDELTDLLGEAGVDVAAEVRRLGDGEAWTVEPIDEPDATGARLVAEPEGPSGFGEALAALTAGLEPDDGAVLRDLSVERTDDGGYRVTLLAGLEPPTVVGEAPVDPGAPVFDGEDLRRLLAEEGEAWARADLRITLPSPPTVVTGDGEVDGNTVTFRLPVDGLAAVEVTAPPPPSPFDRRFLGVVVAGLVAGAGVVLLVRAARG